MSLNHSLAQRQQLTLSPRLYQSLKILRLGAADLSEIIQQELDENPTLELPEPSDFDLAEAPGRELWEQYEREQYEQVHSGGGSRGLGRQGTQPVNPAELTASPVTLADHLTLQLELENLRDSDRRLGMAIIGNLDEDGYLREPVEEIARATGRTQAAVEKVLKLVQSFDPAGVAARSLEECLGLQLEQLGAGRVAIAIAGSHLSQVARNAFGEIARELKVPVKRVKRAVQLIRTLNPSPGSLFDASPPAGAVIPDVYAAIENGRVQVLANRETVPSLHISSIYREMAKTGAGADPETALYIRGKVRKAARLIRDIEQRRITVTKVARAIAEAQSGFFEQGPSALRPLTLEEIARRLAVHPSTISRAILGKYMSTPFGIVEFRYFFSAGYVTAAGSELAATAVKKRLAGLVAGEDPRRPLSDQKLADLLRAEQINISRRTVAKYREEMGLPPSWHRRQEAAG